ncbi:MAG: ABC transporter permease [Chloroflexi bacterium]|nr:ABC transporter permease [Chloroflexota bacterium]MYK61092.1 ABC transporter permease [Chloroflexota bacterium]
MQRFILRRIFASLVALFLVTIIVFSLSRLVGDPLAMLVSEGGYGISESALQIQREKLHLDKPVPLQYFFWLTDVLRGDLGHDLSDGFPVTHKIREKIAPTVQLGVSAWILATIFGLSFGMISAVKRGSLLDYAVRLIANLGITLPAFYVGIMAILIFAVNLGWVPVTVIGTIGSDDPLATVKAMILPVLTLAWGAAAGYMRLMRSSMLEVLDSEYIKLARAKGVDGSKVIWKHALRNSLIVPITVSALLLWNFVTGTVVVEAVFAWPGLGLLAIEAVVNNNLNLVVGTTLVTGVVLITANLVADVLYVLVDPRIRLS